jgi:hypothetical protein
MNLKLFIGRKAFGYAKQRENDAILILGPFQMGLLFTFPKNSGNLRRFCVAEGFAAY